MLRCVAPGYSRQCLLSFQEPPLWDCLSQKPRSLKHLTVGHNQKMDVILGVGGDGEIKEKEGSKSGLWLDGRSHRLVKDLCLQGHRISGCFRRELKQDTDEQRCELTSDIPWKHPWTLAQPWLAYQHPAHRITADYIRNSWESGFAVLAFLEKGVSQSCPMPQTGHRLRLLLSSMGDLSVLFLAWASHRASLNPCYSYILFLGRLFH